LALDLFTWSAMACAAASAEINPLIRPRFLIGDLLRPGSEFQYSLIES
jgi:hypothetical protein